jgi:hypothetical protein
MQSQENTFFRIAKCVFFFHIFSFQLLLVSNLITFLFLIHFLTI